MKVLMKEIEVIAYFKDEKPPKPIRFRIEGKDGFLKVVDVDLVLNIEEDRRAGNMVLIYDCQGMVGGRQVPFQLFYESKDYSWFLFKI